MADDAPHGKSPGLIDDDPVAAYKGVLRTVLDTRPSGTRQRLAEAIGKNRSFISQISNPAYPTPIPVEHIEAIFDVCHFTPADKKLFLDAYRKAHPKRFAKIGDRPSTRTVTLTVPDLGNDAANRDLDQMIEDMVRRIGKLAGDLRSD